MTLARGTLAISDFETSDSHSSPSPTKSRSTHSSSAEKAATNRTYPQHAKIAGTNRRKSGHHRLIQDDDISFETVIILSDDNKPSDQSNSHHASPPVQKDSGQIAKEQPAAKKQRTEKMPSVEEFLREENASNDENPNFVLMKKAAFLRVSVNYLMMHLGRTPFDFSQQRTLSDLIGEYNRKNRLAQVKRGESDSSK